MKIWPVNCWYVAGFASEIDDGLVARTYLDQPVIIWRDSDGKAAALEDRCPHRLAPLSTGRVADGTIECGYHGLRFDRSGSCVFVPGQGNTPKGTGAKAFPVSEKHTLLWIWLGPADLADESLIPDLHWLDSPGWEVARGYHRFECDYRLINDNLLDLSHETYIHKHTIGNRAVADAPVMPKVIDGRVVRAHREMPDIEPPPMFAAVLGSKGNINRWQIAIYMPPGINMTEAGFHPVGSPRESAFVHRPLHLITPETEHTSHYFWGVPRNFRLGEPDITETMRKSVFRTFDEDKALVEAQDKRLQAAGMPQIPQLAVNVDVAPVQGRRLLAAMIKREADDPRAVHPPAQLASDEGVTMPPAQAAE
ncbi:MAG: Rieske 2Fe-2S domain-containing protein [Beijerinckiaceae bacterium]